jgi:hypothetical protein
MSAFRARPPARTRRLGAVVLTVLIALAVSLGLGAGAAHASAPGRTYGANECVSAQLPCIQAAYQSETSIVVDFVTTPAAIGYDFYHLQWHTPGGAYPQETIPEQRSFHRFAHVAIGTDYTFKAQGCRSHLFGDACGPWTNPVTVRTTTTAIAQRPWPGALTGIRITPGKDGFFQHYAGGVSKYCRQVKRWHEETQSYWFQCENAYFVYGAIRDRWASMGWERSCLGYPVSDEMPWGKVGRISYFQHGRITFRASTGDVSAVCT